MKLPKLSLFRALDMYSLALQRHGHTSGDLPIASFFLVDDRTSGEGIRIVIRLLDFRFYLRVDWTWT